MAPNNSKTTMYRTSPSWNVKVSEIAQNTHNPIRDTLENIKMTPNPSKKMIPLSLGDPTAFGNFNLPPNILDATRLSLESGKYNGYGPSFGFEEARQAVAEYRNSPQAPLTAEDVILTSGCSGALEFCIQVLANPGQNILVPKPSFPLYGTLAKGVGIKVKEYSCLPHKNWEIDLNEMESLIDEGTVALILNNPSNPCGSVFSKNHLLDILKIAEHRKIPIIADEIYEHFTFPGFKYTPVATLTKEVPILSCGGLTKRFLVPGWRMGWVTIHDRNEIFASSGVTKGLRKLTTRIIGPNTIIQGAMPSILKDTPQEFFKNTLTIIHSNALVAYKELSTIPGFDPIMPSGAMYMMVGIDMNSFPEFSSDLVLVEKLIEEQSVFPLPGKCFNYPNYFRIVLTVPEDLLVEACSRMKEFVNKHYVRKTNFKNKSIPIQGMTSSSVIQPSREV